MTAGMNTRNLDAGRISLPRVSLGVLLAGTMLAGGLIGAATAAAIDRADANAAAHAAAIAAALPKESTVVRDGRIAAGNGQLAGDTRGAIVSDGAAAGAAVRVVRQGQLAVGNGPMAGDVRGMSSGATGVAPATAFPAGRDGFGFGQATVRTSTVTIRHAPGRGPLE